MKELESLKKQILPILENHLVHLYEMDWIQESHGKTLRISIMKDDGTIDVDICANVSDDISKLLDVEDPFPFVYFLEVCSPGAERELKTDEDIIRSIGKFVHIDLFESLLQKNSFEGELREFNNDCISIVYRDKTRDKTLDIEYTNIKKIRLAVKV